MDRAEAAAGLWDRIIDEVTELADADWSRSTPCPGWDVHDLIGHLSGLQVQFDGGDTVPPPEGWEPDPDLPPMDAWTAAGVAARRDWLREDLLTELRHARNGHVDRLSKVEDWSAPADGPLGRTTEDGLFQVRMFDLWVHLQDLRVTLGKDVEADDISPAASVCHGYVFGLAPWLFVKRAGAQEHATMALRFGPPLDVDTVVEVSMGRGRLTPEADPGECAVTGKPAGLTLLAAGRRDAAALREAGLLDWSGPRGEEFVQRARLF
jgi:uncharacterized protein (TIGR03083 family)